MRRGGRSRTGRPCAQCEDPVSRPPPAHTRPLRPLIADHRCLANALRHRPQRCHPRCILSTTLRMDTGREESRVIHRRPRRTALYLLHLDPPELAPATEKSAYSPPGNQVMELSQNGPSAPAVCNSPGRQLGAPSDRNKRPPRFPLRANPSSAAKFRRTLYTFGGNTLECRSPIFPGREDRRLTISTPIDTALKKYSYRLCTSIYSLRRGGIPFRSQKPTLASTGALAPTFPWCPGSGPWRSRSEGSWERFHRRMAWLIPRAVKSPVSSRRNGAPNLAVVGLAHGVVSTPMGCRRNVRRCSATSRPRTPGPPGPSR